MTGVARCRRAEPVGGGFGCPAVAHLPLSWSSGAEPREFESVCRVRLLSDPCCTSITRLRPLLGPPAPSSAANRNHMRGRGVSGNTLPVAASNWWTDTGLSPDQIQRPGTCLAVAAISARSRPSISHTDLAERRVRVRRWVGPVGSPSAARAQGARVPAGTGTAQANTGARSRTPPRSLQRCACTSGLIRRPGQRSRRLVVGGVHARGLWLRVMRLTETCANRQPKAATLPRHRVRRSSVSACCTSSQLRLVSEVTLSVTRVPLVSRDSPDVLGEISPGPIHRMNRAWSVLPGVCLHVPHHAVWMRR